MKRYLVSPFPLHSIVVRRGKKASANAGGNRPWEAIGRHPYLGYSIWVAVDVSCNQCMYEQCPMAVSKTVSDDQGVEA
jgi:hypothetical protein